MGEARRHHFLPQVLLRGFQCRVSQGTGKTYLFRKNLALAKLVSIRDVAQQRDFHGRVTDSDLEAKMAKLESDYAPVLRALREGRFESNADDVARLVANISIRTKNLRDGFSVATGLMIDSFAASAGLSKKFRRGVRNKVRKEMRVKLSALPPDVRRKASRYLDSALRNNDLQKGINESARQFQSEIDLDTMAANAHSTALNQALADTPRVEYLKSLSWSVDLRPDATWVLGDVGCVAKYFNNDALGNALGGSDVEVEAICLPVSDRALLVGVSRGSEYQFAPEHVNRASAELSRDFFVSSVDTERERELHARLGLRCQLISEDEIQRVVLGNL